MRANSGGHSANSGCHNFWRANSGEHELFAHQLVGAPRVGTPKFRGPQSWCAQISWSPEFVRQNFEAPGVGAQKSGAPKIRCPRSWCAEILWPSVLARKKFVVPGVGAQKFCGPWSWCGEISWPPELVRRSCVAVVSSGAGSCLFRWNGLGRQTILDCRP